MRLALLNRYEAVLADAIIKSKSGPLFSLDEMEVMLKKGGVEMYGEGKMKNDLGRCVKNAVRRLKEAALVLDHADSKGQYRRTLPKEKLDKMTATAVALVTDAVADKGKDEAKKLFSKKLDASVVARILKGKITSLEDVFIVAAAFGVTPSAFAGKISYKSIKKVQEDAAALRAERAAARAEKKAKAKAKGEGEAKGEKKAKVAKGEKKAKVAKGEAKAAKGEKKAAKGEKKAAKGEKKAAKGEKKAKVAKGKAKAAKAAKGEKKAKVAKGEAKATKGAKAAKGEKKTKATKIAKAPKNGEAEDLKPEKTAKAKPVEGEAPEETAPAPKKVVKRVKIGKPSVEAKPLVDSEPATDAEVSADVAPAV